MTGKPSRVMPAMFPERPFMWLLNICLLVAVIGVFRGWFILSSEPALEQAPLPAVLVDPGNPEVSVTISAQPGTWQLISFWATWCHACEKDAPKLNEMAEWGRSAGLKVWGLASYDELERVVASAKFRESRYRILLDQDGETARRFGVHALPQTFLVDGKGRLAVHIKGTLKDGGMKRIKALVKGVQLSQIQL